jgi:Fe2+ transport system protein FeoA
MFIRFVARETSPNIVLTRVTHHATAGMVDCYLRALEPQLEHGPVEIFHDWAGVTGYDTEARRRMTAWGSTRGQAITHVHLLLGSKVLAMGVSVASLALGRDFAVHYDRVRWEASLAMLLPDYRLRLL